MSQETSDILLGVAVLIPFLICVFAAGFILNRFKNRRFVKAWASLVPIIGGKVIDDGGGATTSWLKGTYQGRQVWASMVPNRNRYSGETGHYYNYFDITIQGAPGGQDWSVEHKTALLGFGATGWKIETSDPALEVRLRDAGVIDMLAGMGMPKVEYKRRDGTLVYSEDVTPQWVPTPERFQEELGLLVRLVKLNEDLNKG